MTEIKDLKELTEIKNMLKERKDVKNESPNNDYIQQKVDYYNNSEGNLNKIDGINCSVCKNKGYIAGINELGYEVYTECKCKPTRDAMARARRSGLGDILIDFTFDKYIVTEEWQKAFKDKALSFCVDDKSKWFFVGGQSGAGKTFLCTAIAGHYIKAGREVKYMMWCEDSKTLKALANDHTYGSEIAVYKNIDVLYIDDFLKTENDGEPTGADMRLAFEIINHRALDKNKITIISSEYQLSEVIEFDEATMGRLAEKAGNYVINIAKDRKKNYRLKGLTL